MGLAEAMGSGLDAEEGWGWEVGAAWGLAGLMGSGSGVGDGFGSEEAVKEALEAVGSGLKAEETANQQATQVGEGRSFTHRCTELEVRRQELRRKNKATSSAAPG